MRKRGVVRKALALPAEQKVWLVVFVFGALIAPVAVRVLPGRAMARLMGSHLENRRVCVIATEEQWRKAKRMGNLMHAVGERLVRRSRCLVEALCVKWLLNRYGIPAVFHLGARLDKNAEKGMRAHAWMRVGPVAVIGGPSEREYPIVATFTTPALECRSAKSDRKNGLADGKGGEMAGFRLGGKCVS